ncbi:unnamed protein product [Blepharisma stoltei]|uniref:RING-type domain-containing protein n=1 Tax=Blepharisma stoltei TaxID=1481888 RepID=A0AAU9J1X5_9CILI|nr:unnamed protein product [Blepharisma stoltei]
MNGQLPHIESIDDSAVHGPYRDIIRDLLRNWLVQAIAIGWALILLLISASSSMPLEIPLIPLFVYNIYDLIQICFKINKENSPIPQKFYIREIIAAIGAFLFKVLLIFCINFSNFNIAIAGIPLYISNIISIGIRNSVSIECLNLSYSLKFCSRWMFSVAFLFASLKLNDLIKWNWHFVFWPIYAADMIMIIAIIGGTFLNISIFCKSLRGKASCLDLICPFWGWFTILGSAGSSFLNFYMLADVFDDGELSQMSIAIGFGVLFIVIFVIYTFLFFEYLVKWFDMFFNSRYAEVPIGSINYSDLQHQLGFTHRIAILFKDPPKFLKRISNTFYRPTTETESASIKRASTSQANNADKENSIEIQVNSLIADKSDEDVSKSIEDRLCIICCIDPPNAVIMQCGHAGICFSCGSELVKKECKCMICREPIEQVLEIKEQSESENLVSVVNVVPKPPEENKEDDN